MKIAIALGILLIIAAVWLIRLRRRYTYVLEAKITTGNARDYAVSFTVLHPETKPVEYVWLCLLLAAKLLYVIGNEQKQAKARSELLALIEVLGNTRLQETDDLAHAIGSSIRVDTTAGCAGKAIVARVAYVGPVERLIWTRLPWTGFESQFPHSFLAVVHSVLPRLDDLHRQRLQGSLAEMSDLYLQQEQNPASIDELWQVPHLAFMDAKVIT